MNLKIELMLLEINSFGLKKCNKLRLNHKNLLFKNHLPENHK